MMGMEMIMMMTTRGNKVTTFLIMQWRIISS
jgi:hypothetical protein